MNSSLPHTAPLLPHLIYMTHVHNYILLTLTITSSFCEAPDNHLALV